MPVIMPCMSDPKTDIEAANGFRDQGLISEEEKGQITSEAAQSDCGK